jgi:hypothetical protein
MRRVVRPGGLVAAWALRDEYRGRVGEPREPSN